MLILLSVQTTLVPACLPAHLPVPRLSQVVLRMNLSMAVDGDVFFVYSVDIPQGDDRRVFSFFLDGQLMDTSEVGRGGGEGRGIG